MTSTRFVFTYSPGKLGEFIEKLQSVGAPAKVTTEYPKSIGFGSSHARSFPAVLKYAGLLDSSGRPTEIYKKGLRGGASGRALVGKAIVQAYKPLFDVYDRAENHSEPDLVTLVKSNSDLDDEKAALVVRTFKVLCKFGDFDGVESAGDGNTDDGRDPDSGENGSRAQRRTSNSSSVVINVNIALSVDATSDPAVYDAFFAAMAKHLKGLTDDGS